VVPDVTVEADTIAVTDVLREILPGQFPVAGVNGSPLIVVVLPVPIALITNLPK
jgi:hypothetical protein